MQVLHDVILEWFSLVDADCSGCIDTSELTRTFMVLFSASSQAQM